MAHSHEHRTARDADDDNAAGPRRVRWRGTATLTFLLLLVLVGAALFYYQRHQPLKQRHAKLDERLAALSDSNVELEERIEALLKEKRQLEQTHNALQKQVQQREARIEELQGAQEALREQLEEEIERGQVHITGGEGELAVGLADKILFPPGGTKLSNRGKGLLRRVASELIGLEDQIIRVGGHTDNQPLSEQLQDQFATNWELSTARATNVVRFLTEECDIPGERLVAAGFSEYHPAASNRTPRGRRRNRRIELTLLSAEND